MSRKWYADGLHFSCQQCGGCCTGEPGYVWVSRDELGLIAEFLKISEADLRSTNLQDANLSRANLRGAFLVEASLHGANLSGTDFTGANLRGTNLTGTRINLETKLGEKWLLVWEIVNFGAMGRDLNGRNLQRRLYIQSI